MPRLEIRLSQWLKNKIILKSNGNISQYIRELVIKDTSRTEVVEKLTHVKKIS